MKLENASRDKSEFDMDKLKNDLILENNFLIKLVDTIPAKMYFEHEIQEKIAAEKHLSMDKAAEEIKRKSSNNIDLSAKGKHKRARLNPFSQKSVSQIHEELNKKKLRRKKKKKNAHDPSVSLTRAANIEELQKRLQERIDLFQSKRKAAQNNSQAKKAFKNKVKKLKVKQKGNFMKAQEIKTKTFPEKNKDIIKSNEKATFNKDGNLLYSKFEFGEDGESNFKKNEYSGKKTQALLKKAEKIKEKIEKLKAVSPKKAELVTEKEKWKKAIQKTEGVKVRDDPQLLKKSLKREEKKKKKSTKVWKQRNEETEKRQKARQEKRDKNIQQKKKEKKDRKLKLAKKKGRMIPGIK